jgi:SacI restriction endonuclease
MGIPIDFDKARKALEGVFAEAESDYREGKRASALRGLRKVTETLFKSKTQAYREALLGCILARLVDDNIDIRYPVSDHSENSFSGRTLDERVVNPLLVDKGIPVSKAPYLSALRRGVLFVPGGAKGQKDQAAFDALVSAVGNIRNEKVANISHYLK